MTVFKYNMYTKQKMFFGFFCACTLIVSGVLCAPRQSPSATTFDQKQTGEYNIQLHLKDFQIIAVVGDDSFGSDYDYSYDYSDFTVKPSAPPSSTTTKKSVTFEPSTFSSSTQDGDLSSVDLSSPPTSRRPLMGVSHPYPIVSPSTTNKPSPTTTKATIDEGLKPHIPSIKETPPPELSTTVELTEKVSMVASSTTTASSSFTAAPSSIVQINTLTIKPTAVETAVSTNTSSVSTSLKPLTSIPGQIPVVVQDFSIHRDETPIVKDKQHELIKDKKSDGVTSVAIVSVEDANLGEIAVNEQPALGEILHYRRCAQGYQRDKRGRCRKVRRPQIPLGLTRFASNLAARFRKAESTPRPNDEGHDIFVS